MLYRAAGAGKKAPQKEMHSKSIELQFRIMKQLISLDIFETSIKYVTQEGVEIP